MIGAIIGDIIGSPYEFDRGDKTKDFPLFSRRSEFTDDTVMTLAVAQGFLDAGLEANDETIRNHVVLSMRELAGRYPNAGYGGRFSRWLTAPAPQPYNSWGNGSAMRVSSAACRTICGRLWNAFKKRSGNTMYVQTQVGDCSGLRLEISGHILYTNYLYSRIAIGVIPYKISKFREN